MTEAQKIEREQKMFGMSKSALDNALEGKDSMARLMYAMGLLSDAQEELRRYQGETVRQMMNIAKYVISLECDRARVLATLMNPKCSIDTVAQLATELARK